MANEKWLIDANDVYALFERNGMAKLHVGDIDLIPRVNAVEVVRCKDCKWRQQDDVNRNFCGLGDFYCGDTDYCSRAERKDNERTD